MRMYDSNIGNYINKYFKFYADLIEKKVNETMSLKIIVVVYFFWQF